MKYMAIVRRKLTAIQPSSENNKEATISNGISRRVYTDRNASTSHAPSAYSWSNQNAPYQTAGHWETMNNVRWQRRHVQWGTMQRSEAYLQSRLYHIKISLTNPEDKPTR
jgi:hypothetical protein